MPELRVFVSSTFRDLQEEREHLVKKIFPEIRALCRERGITFTEVDLRWGLTDENVVLGQVIRTCLEEVDKCRPYFIGITGDRYGFVPTYLDIQKDPTLLEQYPWIDDAALEGMSITEMEAHYAVLAPPPPHPSLHEGRGGPRSGPGWDSARAAELEKARFYFRRQRETFEDDAHENEELRRLKEYQERIRASGVTIETFRDPISLGEMIYDDLVKIIKKDFADAKPPTPLEVERSRHEAFALSRRRAYIANPAYLKRLNDHVASNDPPLVVYAESGSGKSSLFAFWADQYRRKHPDAHVIEHYVGIGATATDHYAVIRHICMEIKERFGRDEEIPTEPEKLETALGQWLGYAEHELRKARTKIEGRKDEADAIPASPSSSDSSFILHPSSFDSPPSSPNPPLSSLIVILDGLNQLQGDALNLRWIPDVISPAIRLIVSSTVEGTLVELEKRGWLRFGMQALSEAERETIIVRYLAEYHKSLNAQQIARISGDHKCGHPLFLKTVLEELRLVGRHEELDARIGSYLGATGTEDLFQQVLERLEEDYNMRAVRDVLSLLCVSRSGLDESELCDISGLARLKIATMTAGLDYHLVRKEGRLTFFHDYLRRAVEKRYLANETKQRSMHLQIADYFQSAVMSAISSEAPVLVRMASELCYQLQSGGALDRLRESMSSMPLFLALYDGPTQYEVLGYWSAICEGSEVADRYSRGLESWSMQDPQERSRGMGRVAHLLERLGEWSGAVAIGRKRHAWAKEHGLVSEEASSRLSLGMLLLLRGEYGESLAESSQALDLFSELGDRRGVAATIGSMGVVYSGRGDYDLALEFYERMLRICDELGDRSGVSAAMGNTGTVHYRRGEYDQALRFYERQLRICEESGDRGGVSSALGNSGLVYASRGKYDQALEFSGRQLAICTVLGDRRGVSSAIGNMGFVCSSRGEYDLALEFYERMLRICEELGDRSGVSVAMGNIGTVHANRGEYDRALECYERMLRVCDELGDRNGVSLAIGNMGLVYSSRGEYDRALDGLQRAATEHREVGNREGMVACLLGIADVVVDLAANATQMPEYLPQYVTDAADATPHLSTVAERHVDWRAMALRRARECTVECIAIGEDLSRPDTLFSSTVLLARIDAAEGRSNVASQRLSDMLAEATEDAPQAELHYWLWKLGSPDHGATALTMYEALHARIPKHDYHNRIEELKAGGYQA